MTVEFPPDFAARVQEEARKEGLQPDEFVLRAVAEKLSNGDPMKRVLWNGMTVEEWIRESRAWIQSLPPMPHLSDEALSRESMYEDERL